MTLTRETKEALVCFHCGDLCQNEAITRNDKFFCCTGCKTVFEILNSSNLCKYYSLETTPGITQKNKNAKKFDYLEESEVISRLVEFKDDRLTSVTFYIPQMHCSSCIWLLENLYKLNPAVNISKVDFLKKELSIRFNHNDLTLRQTVELITSIGYEPYISLEQTDDKKERNYNKKLYYRFGVAAFCFGNMMLLSFPEYLSIDIHEVFYRKVFMYLNLLLAMPVFFYSSSEYFISAYKGLKRKIINIDFPLSLGIVGLFGRSVYDILSMQGSGYLDSLGGLLFFLLLGKIFQSKTYESLNFDRSYKSYFPLSVIVRKNGKETSISIKNLVQGDRIIIRNNEIIPADSILFSERATIDYSFVTGESVPVSITEGDLVYAGGRQTGSAVELEVVKQVSQSYLTQLWNNDAFQKQEDTFFTQFSNKLSKYFTIVILAIALAASLFWLSEGLSAALTVFTAVLIVACPCALAMSTPFTLGNTLRIFGRNKLYLKNTNTVENLSKITDVVFDKTGTITQSGSAEVRFVGDNLTDYQTSLITSLVHNSTHPLSKKIFTSLKRGVLYEATDYAEIPNAGIEGCIFNKVIKLGSKSYVTGSDEDESLESNGTKVYISINGQVLGYFKVNNTYRKGLSNVINSLKNKFRLSVVSGDNESERNNLVDFFGKASLILFNQSPQKKLNFIKELQLKGSNVLMIGDGLNDAGALSQSDTGISVTEDIGTFTPACDGILDSESFSKIPDFLWFAGVSRKIIIISFIISFVYNIVGLTFAIRGLLSPLFAAVLMPLSSISVVLFTTFSTRLVAKRRNL